jgi:hypothetical protein
MEAARSQDQGTELDEVAATSQSLQEPAVSVAPINGTHVVREGVDVIPATANPDSRDDETAIPEHELSAAR